MFQKTVEGGGGEGTKETKSGERNLIKLRNYYYSEVKDKKNNHTLPLQNSTNIAIDLKTGEYGENSSQSGYNRHIYKQT